RKNLEAELKTLSNHLSALPQVQPLQLFAVQQRIEHAEEARDRSRTEVERLQGLEYRARAWMDLQGRLSQASERLERSRRLLVDASAIEKDIRRLEELREVLPRMEQIAQQRVAIVEADKKIALLTGNRQKL